LSVKADASDSEQSLRSRAVKAPKRFFIAPQAVAQYNEATKASPTQIG